MRTTTENPTLIGLIGGLSQEHQYIDINKYPPKTIKI